MANNNIKENVKKINKEEVSSKATNKASKSASEHKQRSGMSYEKAGHLGGIAPHKCRGLECDAGKEVHGVKIK